MAKKRKKSGSKRRSGKGRTAKQRAATRKLVALNKARARGGSRPRSRRHSGGKKHHHHRGVPKSIVGRVERLERFAVRQMYLNRDFATNIKTIYSRTQIGAPPRPMKQMSALGAR